MGGRHRRLFLSGSSPFPLTSPPPIAFGPTKMEKNMTIIKDIRAFTVESSTNSSTDYVSQPKGHWITDTLVANPMAIYPKYRGSRTSWNKC